jgi:hypothetical protein
MRYIGSLDFHGPRAVSHHLVIPNPRGRVSGFALVNSELRKDGVRDLLFAF